MGRGTLQFALFPRLALYVHQPCWPACHKSQQTGKEVMQETAKEDVYSMGRQQTVLWGEEEPMLTFHYFPPLMISVYLSIRAMSREGVTNTLKKIKIEEK